MERQRWWIDLVMGGEGKEGRREEKTQCDNDVTEHSSDTQVSTHFDPQGGASRSELRKMVQDALPGKTCKLVSWAPA